MDIPNLLSLLRGGGEKERVHAAKRILKHLSATNGGAAAVDQTRELCVDAGLIAPLIVLLDSSSADSRLWAAAVLRKLSVHSSAPSLRVREAILTAGGVKPLLALVLSEKGKAQEHVAGALQALTFSERGRELALALSALPSLVKVLSSANNDTTLRLTVETLRNLAIEPCVKVRRWPAPQRARPRAHCPQTEACAPKRPLRRLRNCTRLGAFCATRGRPKGHRQKAPLADSTIGREHLWTDSAFGLPAEVSFSPPRCKSPRRAARACSCAC